MELTDQQKQALAGWVAEGVSLSDIQKRLESDFELRMTYMDVRFLVDDLDLDLSAGEPEPEPESAAPADDSAGASVEEPAAGGAGGVSIEVDAVMRPGAVVSGSVTFSDGEKAVWMLDQMGRPGLDPDTAGYRPSEADIMAFQTKLREVLSREGE